MPIYEYHCGKCGDFEAMQKMSDKPLSQCPTCRRKVTKLMSSTTFHLKGSGWYVTDYARKSEGGAAKGDTKKSGTASASDAGTSEASNKPSKPDKSAASTKTEKAAVA